MYFLYPPVDGAIYPLCTGSQVLIEICNFGIVLKMKLRPTQSVY